MTDNTGYTKRFFQHILDRNLSTAKAILKENIDPNDNEEWGKYMACKGIISMLDNKKIGDDIFEDLEKMMDLRKILASRINSIWFDEFDKGYFGTWIKLISFARRKKLSGASIKEGVD